MITEYKSMGQHCMEGPGGIITGNILCASVEPVRGERPHREREREWPCLKYIETCANVHKLLGFGTRKAMACCKSAFIFYTVVLHNCNIFC